MKQLSSKRVRVELENKHSAFSAALCKDSLLEHGICDYYVWEDARHFLFDANTVHNAPCSTLLQCLWLHTYTLYYLVGRHKELLKKHHKIVQIISRVKLIKNQNILPFQSLTRHEAQILKLREKILLCHNRTCSDMERSVELCEHSPRQILPCQWDSTVEQLKEYVLGDVCRGSPLWLLSWGGTVCMWKALQKDLENLE